MAKHKIMRGDQVKVIRGNYRDMVGSVLEVYPETDRIRVEGVNMRKRHTRPSEQNPDGGIISFEGAIHISNVMLVDPGSDQASRVRIRVEEDGSKQRISVMSGNPLPKPQ